MPHHAARPPAHTTHTNMNTCMHPHSTPPQPSPPPPHLRPCLSTPPVPQSPHACPPHARRRSASRAAGSSWPGAPPRPWPQTAAAGACEAGEGRGKFGKGGRSGGSGSCVARGSCGGRQVNVQCPGHAGSHKHSGCACGLHMVPDQSGHAAQGRHITPPHPRPRTPRNQITVHPPTAPGDAHESLEVKLHLTFHFPHTTLSQAAAMFPGPPPSQTPKSTTTHVPGDAHQALEVELHLAEHLQLVVVRLIAPGGVRARVDDVVEV